MIKQISDWKEASSLPVFITGLVITVIIDCLFTFYSVRFVSQRILNEGNMVMDDLEKETDHHVQIAVSQGNIIAHMVHAHETIKEDHFYNQASQIAAMTDDVRSIGWAPDGRFTYIFPHFKLSEEQKDLMNGLHPKKARIAKEEKRTVTFYWNEKPSGIKRQGIGIYHPLYILDETNEFHFWGFTIVAIDLDALMKSINMDDLQNSGIGTCLVRKDEDLGTENVIFSHGGGSIHSITVSKILDGNTWTLQLYPLQGWIPVFPLLLITWGGLMTSLLVARVIGKNRVLRKVGLTDALTGALNRKGGDLTVSKYLRSHPDAEGLVIFLDIDNFKLINDMHGHPAGDMALQQLVHDCKKAFGPEAVYIRNGGDEFVIFLPYTSIDSAIKKVDDFAGMKHEVKYKAETIYFTSSVGCARYPEQGKNFGSLCVKADFALYRAKANGKAGWRMYDRNMSENQQRLEFGFSLSDITNGMPGALVVCRQSPDLRVLYASRKMVELYGCGSYEEFMEYIHASGTRLIYPDERDRDPHDLLDCAKKNGGHTPFMKFRILSKKGSSIPVKIVGQLGESAHFGEVFYIFFYRDNKN